MPNLITIITMLNTGLLIWLVWRLKSVPTGANLSDLAPAPRPTSKLMPVLPPVLIDTSVIIDGRIADIAASGFVPGKITVPKFVLSELQNIADSEDDLRRARGRRGLETLQRLRELPGGLTVTDEDVTGVREVDAKLVKLGQKLKCSLLTTDFNLGQVASVQGVRILNINELAGAIRPVVVPGEPLQVTVVQTGKGKGQGVGYLDDGTMIVVENGAGLIGQTISTEVTRAFQSAAGKMIFATPVKK